MRYVDGNIQLSASDLVNHLACRRLTGLNREVAAGARSALGNWDPALQLLWERGLAHEQSYVQHLRDAGRQVTVIGEVGVDDKVIDSTLEAMSAGREVIVQGALSEGSWSGRPDILRRVAVPSKLGGWSYEVIDTKLARETQSGTILQLSLYSDLLRSVQGTQPEYMYVVAPWTGFDAQPYRTVDFAAYYRLVRRWLEAAVWGGNGQLSYPDPREHCDVCRWNRQCDLMRRGDDHLSLVAGISGLQIDELRQRGITTTAGLAAEPVPLQWRPGRGAVATYERVRQQARVQVEDRTAPAPVYEALEPQPGIGLATLPEPSPGDVFLDFEGDPFVGPGGMEYLFGYVTDDGDGHPEYTGNWALSPEDEKLCFKRLADWLTERWASHPDMHVYHFAPYEPSAMKRLMSRYTTREDEIDRMLRAGLFVDLYRVVRGGLRAGVESYSIKELERFYGFQREVPLTAANRALFAVTAPLELGDPDGICDDQMELVEAYNRDDCVSTYHLRAWLEGVREELIDASVAIERPAPGDADASEALTERQLLTRALAERLAGDVPLSVEERTEEQHARWLLANMLDWHRREEKATWWEYFRLSDCSVEDLIEERQALAQLEFAGAVGGTARSPIHRYRFPVQETDLRGTEKLRMTGGDDIGTLVSLDSQGMTVDIKKRGAAARLHPDAVFSHDLVNSDVLKNSLFRIGEDVADNVIAGDGTYRASRDLLLREPPRLGGEPVRSGGESALDAAIRIAQKVDFGVLPVQGPPGSGKTYTGARMVCELVAHGARVGITANSHRVIINLLDEIMAAADERGLDLRAVRKISGSPSAETQDPRVTLAKTNPQVFSQLAGFCQVAAGTAWLWSRPEAMNSVDVLFVDEAAQVSLANILAMSHAGRSMVLLGDPQQLDQPMQGTHPDGTDVSALGHLLGERQTIEEGRGLFLEQTWRLHPDICDFTTETSYDGRLGTRPGLEQQRVVSPGPINGTGLRFVPVQHRGNRSSSEEEAERVADLVRGLVSGDSRWTDGDGNDNAITLEDVLIIAPYNAQVFRIQERLPEARVGTVDKFQGQEAPVVIYSMATSTPEDAPHGMEFLYSLNRLNVATSRARCVCVLVGSPELYSPECRTPRQMQLANAFCRYRELASEIAL